MCYLLYMKELFNKYSKEDLEKCWMIVTLISAISILFGILYQYSALDFWELSFFSWTQAINDGMKIAPLIVSIFMGGYLWYKIITLLSDVDFYNKNTTIARLITGIVFWIEFILIANNKNPTNFPKNNLIGTLVFGAIFFICITHIILWAYIIFGWNSKRSGWRAYFELEALGDWLKRKHKLLTIILILTISGISISFLLSFPQVIDKNNCVLHKWTIYKVKYLNDRYVFTDKHVFENKDLEFYKWKSCE